MKFGLDIQVEANVDGLEGKAVALAELSKNLDQAKTLLGKPDQVLGAIVPLQAGKPAMAIYSDPLLPLLEQWLLKIPWLLGGDTEIIPLKNSAHTFGFEPVSDVLDLSCFVGEKNEIESYILEPMQVGLDSFCDTTIAAAKQLIRTLDAVNPRFSDSVSDVQTLKEAAVEAERALKNYRLQR